MSRYGRSEHGSRSEHGEQVRAWQLTYLFVKESRREREREVRAKGEMRRGGVDLRSREMKGGGDKWECMGIAWESVRVLRTEGSRDTLDNIRRGSREDPKRKDG